MSDYAVCGIDTTPGLDPYHRDTSGETKTTLWISPRNKKCGISQEYDDNATSIDVWNGLEIECSLHFRPDENDARMVLEDSELVQRVIDGWDSDWDGNNIVGHLDDDAQSALDELVTELEKCSPNPNEMWSCGDWLGNCSAEEIGISKEMTEEEIKLLAEKLVEETENIVFSDDMEAYLKRRQEWLKDEE